MPAKKAKKIVSRKSKKTTRRSSSISPRSLILLFIVLISIAIIFVFAYTKSVDKIDASYDPNSKVYSAIFEGSPDMPSAYSNLEQADFDIAIHSRDTNTWERLTTMSAHHSSNCGAPLDSSGGLVTHMTTGIYEDAVFKCKDHVMTSMNEEGYGMIYLTPSYFTDITSGTASIKFDVSTYRSSSRDWIDLWLTPYGDNLQLPLDSWLPDVQGTPKNAIHIKEDNGIFKVYVIRNYVESEITINSFEKYDSVLTPSPKDRATFELQISKNHIKFGIIPQPLTNNQSIYWADTDIADLNWTDAVLQLGHHSYNPTKDCNVANTPGPDNTCKPNTWHWDNITMTNATPFTMIKADKRVVSTNDELITLQSPVLEDSYLRFSAVGTVKLSFDNGASWVNAVRANGSSDASGNHHPEHASSYFTPIPAGATTVKFRFSGDGWYNGAWPYQAKDFAVWSKTLTSTPPTLVPTEPDGGVGGVEEPTNTPTPTSTPIPTATPTAVPTSTPTPTIPSGAQVTVQRALTVKNNDSTLIGTKFNNNATTAKLGKDGSKSVSNFNLFPSLNIPKNATIINAAVSYELVGYGGGSVNVKVAAHDTGSASTPTSRSQFQSKQAQLTSAKVDWNNVTQGDWGTKIKSSNIAPVIQEIVDRSDWNTGNAILLWLGDNNSSNWAHSSYMTANFTGAGQKPTLTVTYVE